MAWTYSDDELAQDPNNAGNYINNLHHQFTIVGNQYVKEFGVQVSTFTTEATNDYLQFGPLFGPYTTLSGTPSHTWYDFSTPTGLQSYLGIMLFHTDGDDTYTGFSTGQARVCCQSTPNNGTSNLYKMLRTRGVLLGTNDTVYMNVDYSCTEAAEHQVFTLRGTSGTNFDLYARCGSLPTQATYLSASAGAGSEEFIHLNANACTCPTTLYVAVNSSSGSGTFDLVRGSHYTAQHKNLKAGTAFAASAPQMTTFRTTLEAAAKRFYGSTEGTQQIGQIDLYNNGSCANCGGATCDICFKSGCVCGGLCTGASSCGGSVNICQDYYSGSQGVNHEFGHYMFCVADEYATGWKCGHSIMASPWAQNNICYDFDATRTDHATDISPGETAAPPPSKWKVSFNQGLVSMVPDHTPDNYSYVGFDFNSGVGLVITH